MSLVGSSVVTYLPVILEEKVREIGSLVLPNSIPDSILYTEMCKNIGNRLSEIAPAGRRTLRREFRLPILYLFTPLSSVRAEA